MTDFIIKKNQIGDHHKTGFFQDGAININFISNIDSQYNYFFLIMIAFMQINEFFSCYCYHLDNKNIVLTLIFVNVKRFTQAMKSLLQRKEENHSENIASLIFIIDVKVKFVFLQESSCTLRAALFMLFLCQ